MNQGKIEKLNEILKEAEEKIAASGIDLSIVKVSVVPASSIRQDSDGSTRVSDDAEASDLCCDLWDCRSGRCYCIIYKEC